ncbi:MAG: DUF2933 domain-containing protein [Candidatus Aenigmarchaeota archaeon]|nr:DUF2933 domain-containing protein [Candidatus Aenigmarchaeota archaeon]
MKKHTLLMLACMAVPAALLAIVYILGIRNEAIYWLALLSCPVMHILMMKLHKDEKCH